VGGHEAELGRDIRGQDEERPDDLYELIHLEFITPFKGRTAGSQRG
jgi:hypothetical protein